MLPATHGLDPSHWASWCWLGYLLDNREIHQSFRAYAHCCYFGNNAANGCFHAGRVAEKIGDFDQALYYYLISQPDEADRILEELNADDE